MPYIMGNGVPCPNFHQYVIFASADTLERSSDAGSSAKCLRRVNAVWAVSRPIHTMCDIMGNGTPCPNFHQSIIFASADTSERLSSAKCLRRVNAVWVVSRPISHYALHYGEWHPMSKFVPICHFCLRRHIGTVER